MNISIQAIPAWPRKLTGSRHHSRFKVTYSQTIDLLERELLHLGAHSVAMQIAIRPEDIRLDGQMRANIKPSHPGVILCFTGKHGPVTMPCDHYTHWHDNLRAIALSLEALRAVDRHGVTTSGEQYKGWKQLPGGIELGPATLSIEDAARELMSLSNDLRLFDGIATVQRIVGDVGVYKTMFRRAVTLHHSDSGGDRSAWDKLQQVADVLKNHHGLA